MGPVLPCEGELGYLFSSPAKMGHPLIREGGTSIQRPGPPGWRLDAKSDNLLRKENILLRNRNKWKLYGLVQYINLGESSQKGMAPSRMLCQ
jgi:hypothetical protein